MNNENRKFFKWITIAGILFIFIAIHDTIYLNTNDKSAFMVSLEFVAGISFIINALVIWKKQ